MSKPQIWSLVDIMRQFDAWQFAELVQELTKFYWIAIRKTGDGEEVEVDKNLLPDLDFLVEGWQKQTKQLQLKASHERAKGPLRDVLFAYGHPTWGTLKHELRVLWQTLLPELLDRRFAYIESKKGEHLDELLGEPVHSGEKKHGPSPIWLNIWKRFPSAKEDCEESVYCYALERNIACVFHSMRVAEVGLRALARRMKVTLPKKRPLAWGQWQEILKEMRGKTDYIHLNAKAGPAKDELLEFYNGAIGQFYGFKDEFRNQVMHQRKTYDEFDSAKALTRVRDFMEHLAKRIDERGRRIKA